MLTFLEVLGNHASDKAVGNVQQAAAMSAFGYKRTSTAQISMSAFRPKADIVGVAFDFRL